MNRRRLLSLIGLAPVAAVVGSATIQAKPVEAFVPVPGGRIPVTLDRCIEGVFLGRRELELVAIDPVQDFTFVPELQANRLYGPPMVLRGNTPAQRLR